MKGRDQLVVQRARFFWDEALRSSQIDMRMRDSSVIAKKWTPNLEQSKKHPTMADIPFGGTGILRFGATFTNPYISILSRSLACPRNALNRRRWDGKLEPGSSILVRGEQEAVYSLAAGFGDCSYLYPAILETVWCIRQRGHQQQAESHFYWPWRF